MSRTRVEALECLERCEIKSKLEADQYSCCRDCWIDAHRGGPDDPEMSRLNEEMARLQRERDRITARIQDVSIKIEERKK